ncbi:BON domain-containing protein [Neorhizobium sp. NPDC001467]|uniref:BON domain-containing protein n=1 Tax=Neorhizobium sp. NPDC001467 TaxID=3390595 RepID=UPI003CFC77E9
MANGSYNPSGGFNNDRNRQDRDTSTGEFGFSERDYPRERDNHRFSTEPFGERSYEDRHNTHENRLNRDIRSSDAGYSDSRYGSSASSSAGGRDTYRGDFDRNRNRPEYRFGERQRDPVYSDSGRYQDRGYDDRNDGRRGFVDRASDEVASWFGDDAARERRAMDEHRGKGPKGYKRSDARIEEDINDRLSDDPMLDASNISVTVKESEVTLEGSVSSRWDKRRAEDIADDISGVSHVQNNLRVSTGTTDILTGSTVV